MKRLFLLVLLSIGFMSAQAQDRGRYRRIAKDSLPYMKFPELPAFNIRLMDSTTIFNTFNIPSGAPSIIFFFDPGCKHCQDVTTELLRGIDSIKDVQLYFVTPNPNFTEMRRFYNENHLDKYPNIKAVGRDYEFFFIDYYHVNSFPDLALYSADKQILNLFEGRATVKEIYDYTHKK